MSAANPFAVELVDITDGNPGIVETTPSTTRPPPEPSLPPVLRYSRLGPEVAENDVHFSLRLKAIQPNDGSPLGHIRANHPPYFRSGGPWQRRLRDYTRNDYNLCIALVGDPGTRSIKFPSTVLGFCGLRFFKYFGKGDALAVSTGSVERWVSGFLEENFDSHEEQKALSKVTQRTITKFIGKNQRTADFGVERHLRKTGDKHDINEFYMIDVVLTDPAYSHWNLDERIVSYICDRMDDFGIWMCVAGCGLSQAHLFEDNLFQAQGAFSFPVTRFTDGEVVGMDLIQMRRKPGLTVL
ncbi:hypothetical protein N0V88_002666 [Collariella sp. IMI 366227]|nr:hypothetical protein N0V88_002666 [Collariella sp. IMI 366227]